MIGPIGTACRSACLDADPVPALRVVLRAVLTDLGGRAGRLSLGEITKNAVG